MAIFIILHQVDGNDPEATYEIRVNIEHLLQYHKSPDPDRGSELQDDTGSSGDSCYVRETPDEIDALIKETKKLSALESAAVVIDCIEAAVTRLTVQSLLKSVLVGGIPAPTTTPTPATAAHRCPTCKHYQNPAANEPCKSCRGASDLPFTKWEKA